MASSSRGFTLIELMVAIVIISILAAIALPAYTDYLRRGKIADAVSGLSDMRVRFEQWFQDNRSYAGGCANMVPNTTNFTFACNGTPDATTYSVTATGIGSMAGFSYTINQAGARSSTITGVSGWTGNASCWALKKDGSC